MIHYSLTSYVHKMDEIQKVFKSLLNSLHECWYLNEQHPGSYNQTFSNLLKKYHKISWEEECDMVMDKNYFDCILDASKAVSKSVYYTHQLHLILCELPKYWQAFVFSYSEAEKKRTADTFNRYATLYNEFAKKPKKD